MKLTSLPLILAAASPSLAQMPLTSGDIAATSHSGYLPWSGTPDPDGFVLGVIDGLNIGAAPTDTNWFAPIYNGPPGNQWTATNMGQVFGLAIDDKPNANIYVSATSSYGADLYGPGGSGGIYKINGSTGIASPITTTVGNVPVVGTRTLPNTNGCGLGNLCWHPAHDMLYVTNFEDGKIYRLSTDGDVLEAYDPFGPDDGIDGFAPLGERLWGIQTMVAPDLLFFGVWKYDSGRTTGVTAGPAVANNSVWAIRLGSDGSMNSATPVLIKEMPALYTSGQQYSNPVSDIAIVPRQDGERTGRLLLAERSMGSDTSPSAHQSRVLEYSHPIGPPWPSGYQLSDVGQVNVGRYNISTNSAGGVSAACDASILATGDALRLDSQAVYGVQFSPRTSLPNLPGAAATADAVLIDLDSDVDSGDKTLIGDVEVFVAGHNCLTSYGDPGGGCTGTSGGWNHMGHAGSVSVANNNFWLYCSGVPANNFGLFLASPSQGGTPIFGGNLLLGAPLYRLGIDNSGDTETLLHQLDLSAPFFDGSMIQPGSTMNFQAWYRHPVCGAALSNGVTVTFNP